MHDLLRCATEQAGPHKGAVMSAGANSIASSLRVCEYRIGAFLNKYKIKLVKKKAKYRIKYQILFFLTGPDFPRVLVQKRRLLHTLVSHDVLFTTWRIKFKLSFAVVQSPNHHEMILQESGVGTIRI